MATNTDYNKMVENYLSGDMSGSEKSVFENQLSSDPMLQTELSHQSEIIEGLESFRKTELKMRLAAINVNPTILGLISQTAAIKTAATVATLGLVATGLFYLTNKRADFQIDHVNSLHEYIIEESTFPEHVELLDVVANEKIQPVENNPSVKREPLKNEKLVVEQPNTQAFDFKVPASPDATDSEIATSDENILDENTNDLEGLADVVKLDKVEVENIIDKKYSFHYRYADGRLYLYGKYDVGPYEIIDVNTKNDKKLFFFYQGRYYKILKGAEDITAFEEIKDQSLIRELSILKLKK